MWTKVLFLCTAFAGWSGVAHSQVDPKFWKPITGNDIVNGNTGYVGIQIAPKAPLHVSGDVLIQNGDLRLRSDTDSIRFSAVSGASSTMIEMFESGTVNADRMVLAHSPAFPDWGLQYSDPTDTFRFLRAGTSVMDVNLGSALVEVLGSTRLQSTTVSGLLTLASGARFASDSDSLTFPAADTVNAPMIQMFASGISNANRMVLAHSPDFDNWGLQYRDVGDSFHFVTGGTSVLGVDLPNFEVEINGDMPFTSDTQSIIFPVSSGSNDAMIYMFPSGTANADRMVLAHSPAFPNWGLQYADSPDEFRFVGAASTAMTIELASREVGIRTDNPAAALQVGTAGDGSSALANAWNVFSSRDYKKDIVELDDDACAAALDKVVATPVYQFHYKDAPEGAALRIGVIVEDSPEEILAPEVQVDGQTKAVDLARYVSVLHAALKAQQSEIDRLEAQQFAIAELRAEVAALRTAQQR